MTIAPGTRLGPYEILAPIGAGGMGEVFRAKDTRLDRSVAIKVLPASMSANPDLRQRFEREARTISSLNHPNICTLYDIGHHEGTDYLVMELLEGETLEQRLAGGALPTEQVLRYGAEIAEALDKAHRQGITHRDLKPGNIMITRSGAKLLDFGLAKYRQQLEGAPLAGITGMQTEQKQNLTAEGTILGTFQYMAPEQLEGEEADARTDIFALGTVLYEMATGRRAFEAKTKTSLIAAIVSSEPPPISQSQPLAPPALEHVVRKCLAKGRDDRWQSAHDIAEELKWIREAGSQAGVATPLTVKRKHRERMAWMLNLATAVAAVALTWTFIELRKPPVRAVESVILPPDNHAFMFLQGAMALSPDGTRIAFLASEGRRNPSLFVRPLDSGVARQLAGTEGASHPFWSPDSRQLGFFADGKLKTIDEGGGSVQTICDAPRARGGSWGTGGMIVFAPTTNDAIFAVPATGGSPSPVTRLKTGEAGHRWPSFLPDGRNFLFLSAGAGRRGGIYAGSTDGKEQKHILTESSSVAYAPPGYLVFARNPTLVAQRFDTKRLELSGGVYPVAERVALNLLRAIFSISQTGDLVFQKGSALASALAPTQLVWVDRQGKEIAPIAPPALYFSPKISHDGRRVAVDISAAATGLGDIWIFDLVRSVSSRLTYHPANESGPVWSADDREITYFSEKNTLQDLYRISSGGIGEEQTILESAANKLPTDVSRDGRWLVFVSNANRGQLSDIWIYSTLEKKAMPWLATPFAESCASFSPDGKWMAYQSNESGRNEVYVRSFPESREKWLLSNGGGTMPAWRNDGRELFYISPERKMMTVPIKLTPAFESGTPAALFEAMVLDHPSTRQYDVSADGARFLLNRESSESMNEPITLVQNWTARLKSR